MGSTLSAASSTLCHEYLGRSVAIAAPTGSYTVIDRDILTANFHHLKPRYE
jgi:hypothetical protein